MPRTLLVILAALLTDATAYASAMEQLRGDMPGVSNSRDSAGVIQAAFTEGQETALAAGSSLHAHDFTGAGPVTRLDSRKTAEMIPAAPSRPMIMSPELNTVTPDYRPVPTSVKVLVVIAVGVLFMVFVSSILH